VMTKMWQCLYWQGREAQKMAFLLRENVELKATPLRIFLVQLVLHLARAFLTFKGGYKKKVGNKKICEVCFEYLLWATNIMPVSVQSS
jgi:hypothetical protein